MAKKRTSLESLFAKETTEDTIQTIDEESTPKTAAEAAERPKVKKTNKRSDESSAEVISKTKNEIIKQTVYLPSAVHEQLRQLAFEERKKMHDYLVEGLDRVFKDRGLKSYIELSDAAK